MKLIKVSVALLSASVTCSIQAGIFDISGQISGKNSGDLIEGAKITLQEVSVSNSISGRVLDSVTQQGISGAQVFIDVQPEIGGESPAIAITDSDGYYLLDGLTPEKYTIGVWKRGYEIQYRMNLDLVANQNVAHDLAVKPVEMSEDYVVLLRAEFDSVKFHPDHDAAWAEQLYFDDTPGAASIRNFYYQLSHGHLDLKKGANVLVQVTDPDLQYPHENSDRDDIVDYVVSKSTTLVNYNDPKYDRSTSWDHEPGADDKIDHVVVMTAGLPKSITGSSCDMNPVSMLNSEYVTSTKKSPVQSLVPEYSPLGNIAHEMYHSMGETAVQDLYIGGTCNTSDELSTPLGTVGKWGTMGIGMYNKLNSFITDPRGSSCEAGYIDPCEGKDGMCSAHLVGEQPSLPTPWTLWKWYHKTFWENNVLEATSVSPGKNKTIRVYPYSTTGNGTQAVMVYRSNSSQWWSITNRQPIGFDRGLVHSSSGEGQTGIVIDFNDTSLAGRMKLKGPVRIRDSHPGTLPDYTHYGCRARIDDAAFNIGEVEEYQEDELSVQLLEEHEDGSITVMVSSGSSNLAATSAQKNVTALKTASNQSAETSHGHEEITHAHDEITLAVTSVNRQTEKRQPSKNKLNNESTQLNIMSLTPTQTKSSVANVTTTDSNGQYSFNSIIEGDWNLKIDACGFAQESQNITVNDSEVANFELTDDAERTIVSSISVPVSGQSYSKDVSVQLDATSTSTFGNSIYEWRSNLDGLLANSEQASVSLSEGQHEITLTVSNELCSHTNSVMIDVIAGQVNQLPSASFNSLVSGLVIDFIDTSSDSDGTIVSWQWSFGDTGYSTEQNPTHEYLSAGDYSVTLTITDNDGGQTQVSQTVSVTEVSIDPFELVNGVAKTNINIASKDENHYHINVPVGTSKMTINFSGTGDADLYVKAGQQANRNYGGYDYKSAGYGSSETIIVDSPASGDWHIMVYAYSAVTSGVQQVDLVISGENQSPDADFSFSTNELNATFNDLSSDTDGNVASWSWDFGDSSSSTEQNPVHNYTQAGNYQVSLIVIDNDGAQAATIKTVSVTESGDSSDPYELVAGVTLSPLVVGSKAEEIYYINVPQGLTSMTITLSGDGDGDIYVNFGDEPTRNYAGADYKSIKWGSNESISIERPESGTWYIMVYGYKAMTEGSLKVDFN
ncbi:hypothetical protein CJF42_20765 [Pseudoalteromonas sp. NBT06-2]|uniref:PKD domain-containing protein n=1 Tax=Pseudoalteromonas sp. NBT06-2 TaxID=2025950 RepID=UPI000BA52256|nr:PKD domain-containing protein [Pseudoalteromonas sp. NBT06-2]PAJ72527.1 hypothetical protein CJF42_20765 [Pseudoalteromonas sp. NBT06-2]